MLPLRAPLFRILILLAAALLPRTGTALDFGVSTPGLTGTPHVDEIDDLGSELRKAAASRDKGRQTLALDALVFTGKAKAADPITTSYILAANEFREHRAEAARLRGDAEQKEVIVSNLEDSVERNPKLRDQLHKQRDALSQLRNDLGRAESKRDRAEAWSAELEEGLRKLMTRLSDGDRRKVDKELISQAEKSAKADVQLGCLALLGALGGDGTVIAIEKAMADFVAEKVKIERKIPGLMGDVHKFEKRMQEEANRTGGRTGGDTQQLYDRARAEAASMRSKAHEYGLLIQGSVDAGAMALAREDSTNLVKKTLPAFAKVLRKTKDRTRLYLYSMIAQADRDEVREWLRGVAQNERDALGRAGAIQALGALADKEAAAWIGGTALGDENHHVRSAAADALARIRVKEGIPALIARLEVEEGRVRTDIGDALVSLTGKDFHGNVELWNRWWADEGAGFEVPPAPERKSALEEALEARGVTFFGITTESEKVLFVLDLSGSMNFSTAARVGPDARPGDSSSLPKSGEKSRLEVAKRDLVRALGGLDNGGIFNMVLYASDVWTWNDDMVEMEEDSRSQALQFVEEVEAVGGTNIYGAMERAFDVAGVGVANKGEWSKPEIDTIFVLTDGQASVGLTTDREEILAYVRDRNRTAGIVIHTIGLSAAHDAELLRRLAEENDGEYVAR